MDIVTDLTSQAVAGIIIIQDICKQNISPEQRKKVQEKYLWEFKSQVETIHRNCPDSLARSMQDVLFCSQGLERSDDFKICFTKLAERLLQWLEDNQTGEESDDEENKKHGLAKDGSLYCTPYQWRDIIRHILYKKPESRLTLASAIHYMPVQVIFCLQKESLQGTAFTQKVQHLYKKTILFLGLKTGDENRQRLYQTWELLDADHLLNADDFNHYKKWWDTDYRNDGVTRKEMAKKLLVNDNLLLTELKKEKLPLPFETLYNDELNEVCGSRQRRWEDDPEKLPFSLTTTQLKDGESEDPLARAKKLKLYGLALSGGGIRSATFSLGVLQKLAEQDDLQRFDYLSTVSGGGYIGAWLACWIKRSSSLSKVADRLNIKKSSDPLGEEVRPIRWLRMFSNYLAPDASLMSADSWTLAITWLRNTLINQVLILLLLCTAISFVNNLAFKWGMASVNPSAYDWSTVTVWSLIIFFPAILIVGEGMKTFDPKHNEKDHFNLSRSKTRLSIMLIIWAVIVSIVISAWLYDRHGTPVFADKLTILVPAAIVAFVSMVLIAYKGRYYMCVQGPGRRWKIHVAIVISSAVAAGAGLLSLAGVWQLFDDIYKDWIFIWGPPLILECISVSVVVRMAFMGNLFPDERREWWGRMGAIAHRTMLMWILITFGARMLTHEFDIIVYKRFPNIDIKAILGVSWTGLIGVAVKLAYQSKDPNAKKDSTTAMAQDILIRVAPYLFMIGFLLIASYTFKELKDPIASATRWIPITNYRYRITFVLAAITFILSWRIGVNEFSLHHFYRNRLVRAYMGATRKRTERDKTMNNFTGFDKNDDIKLSAFTNSLPNEPYIGPYPIINTTLNATVVSELDRQDRKAESFIFSPLYCGFHFSPTRSAAYAKDNVYDYGYRPTFEYSSFKGPGIGTAMSISGAAVSPNMGYHSSPATAFLLTVFNVRLGRWMGNPRRSSYNLSDPILGLVYLISDLIGKSDVSSRFVCLSDGGHFDNMGLYELIRRRCSNIVLVDAEEDVNGTFEGLANAIRRCSIDYGVEIVIDTTPVSKKDADGFKAAHAITDGTIKYPGDKKDMPSGRLTYIKASLVADDPTDILEYHKKNELFPQQPTSDQFFTEDQFESYRKLGYQSVPAKLFK